MADKLCPMAFGRSDKERIEMNCLGVVCAWWNTEAGACGAVYKPADKPVAKPAAKSSTKK